MTDQSLVLLDIMQNDFEKALIPDPGTEVARNMAVNAAELMRRRLVEVVDMPSLRQDALTAYRPLLPEVETLLGASVANTLAASLSDAVGSDANAENWEKVEAALSQAITPLLGLKDSAAEHLVGRFAAIDANLRDAKEQAVIQRRKPRSSNKNKSGKNVTEDAADQEARLLDFIKRHYPEETDLKITGIKQIPGGFSKHTLFINFEHNKTLPDCIVMRRDGPYQGSSVCTEYPIIQKMYAAGVAVPQPFAIDADGEVYGKPFILVSRAAGTNIGDFVVVREPSRDTAIDLANKMARLHTAPFDGLEDNLVGGRNSITERLLGEIEQYQADWQSATYRKGYVVQAAFDWLKANIRLAEGPRAILHRDIGVHNMLINNNAVSAFVDWETAAVGTPAEDVGYVYYTAIQMTEWSDFIAAYEQASGFKLDPRQLDFYILWASIRLAVPISKNVDSVFEGKTRSLSAYYLGDHIVQVLIQRIASKLAEILA